MDMLWMKKAAGERPSFLLKKSWRGRGLNGGGIYSPDGGTKEHHPDPTISLSIARRMIPVPT